MILEFIEPSLEESGISESQSPPVSAADGVPKQRKSFVWTNIIKVVVPWFFIFLFQEIVKVQLGVSLFLHNPSLIQEV
jgi:hypothetical protein